MKVKTIVMIMAALVIFVSIVTAETPEEWNVKGISFGRSGDYENAIKCFDRAIDLNPNRAEFYSNRGNAYAGLELYERAINDYNKAIELDQNLNEFYVNREVARSKLKEQKGLPGFEALFAIAELLALAYFIRKKSEHKK